MRAIACAKHSGITTISARHDIAMLMELFNHNKEKITLRYIGIDIEEKRAALSKWEF